MLRVLLLYALAILAFAEASPSESGRHSARSRRSAGRWSSWSSWEIESPDDVPSYDQHTCCGCSSGCGPVAWAMVLGYYDRRASSSSDFGYNFWTCSDGGGSSSSGECKAPSSMDSYVRSYIENIRTVLGTSCFFKGGLTTIGEMKQITNWRSLSSSATVQSYDSIYVPTNWALKKAITFIKNGYPTIVGYWLDASKHGYLKGHYAVATKYKERNRWVRKCVSSGYSGRRRCSWKFENKRMFYLKKGWGGSGDGYEDITPWAAIALKEI